MEHNYCIMDCGRLSSVGCLLSQLDVLVSRLDHLAEAAPLWLASMDQLVSAGDGATPGGKKSRVCCWLLTIREMSGYIPNFCFQSLDSYLPLRFRSFFFRVHWISFIHFHIESCKQLIGTWKSSSPVTIMVTQRQKCGTGVRGERPNLPLLSVGCHSQSKQSSRVQNGRNHTTGSGPGAPGSYSILLSSCFFKNIICILIVVVPRGRVYMLMGNVSWQLTPSSLTLPSQLPIWSYGSMPEPLGSALWRLLNQCVHWQRASHYTEDYHSVWTRGRYAPSEVQSDCVRVCE